MERKRLKIVELFLLQETNKRMHTKRGKIINEVEKGDKDFMGTQTATPKQKLVRLNNTDPKAELYCGEGVRLGCESIPVSYGPTGTSLCLPEGES